MTRGTLTRVAIGAGFVLVALVLGQRALRHEVPPSAATSSAIAPPGAPARVESRAPAASEPAPENHQGFLYGRVTTIGGDTYEGRLRWGGGQEAFWGDYFNGAKDENTWAAYVPPERLPGAGRPIKILGFEIARGDRHEKLQRLFMARFGDIARIDARGTDVLVTLRSGTVFDLDRFEASDFDDGLRVWDRERGVVDLDSLRIRAIELLPTRPLGEAPGRLHGTVRTRQGEFTGFVQWDREKCVGLDELAGRTAEGPLRLRFDSIRSIARRSRDSALVTQLDGREIVLSGRETGSDNRGIYVDDPRYGRVLVSWDAFERLDFRPAGSGPAYDEFPPGRPLTGSITTRTGTRLAGRLVYDLDESETTETLDAPSGGVDYTIPFGLIASIVLPGRDERGADHVQLTLHDGARLQLEREGDLGDNNSGMLVFVEGRERPEYVPWAEIQQVEFDRPPAMYPRAGGAVGSGNSCRCFPVSPAGSFDATGAVGSSMPRCMVR